MQELRLWCLTPLSNNNISVISWRTVDTQDTGGRRQKKTKKNTHRKLKRRALPFEVDKSVNFMHYSTKMTYMLPILCIKFKCCNNLWIFLFAIKLTSIKHVGKTYNVNIGYAGVTVMVLNATFKQQYFSYIVTDSGHSRHRRATTKKNKEKHTQKTKTMSNTNHHKTGCCWTPGFTPSFMLLNTWVHTHCYVVEQAGCEPRCSTP
jgi:hypothetical protein